jgi:hypothetical protein
MKEMNDEVLCDELEEDMLLFAASISVVAIG